MKKLLLIIFAISLNACASVEKVEKVLEDAAKIATGPCAQSVAAAVVICKANPPLGK